jgi:hypothetical protein
VRFRLLFDNRQDLPPAGVHADACGDDAVHRAVRVLDANHGDIRLANHLQPELDQGVPRYTRSVLATWVPSVASPLAPLPSA